MPSVVVLLRFLAISFMLIAVRPSTAWSANSDQFSCKLSISNSSAFMGDRVKGELIFSERISKVSEKDIKIRNGAINDFRVIKGRSNAYAFSIDSKNRFKLDTILTTIEVSAGSLKSRGGRLNARCGPLTIKFTVSTPSPPTIVSKTPPPTSAPSNPILPTATQTPAVTHPPTATQTPIATRTELPLITPPSVPTIHVPTASPTSRATIQPTYIATSIPLSTNTPTITPIAQPTIVATNSAGTTPEECQGILASNQRTMAIFPGAEGFGTTTVAGSGRHFATPCSAIYRVNSLADKGPGTLRQCIEGKGPRTCVFEVGGVIWATKALKISNPYITIAGFTAPQPGIVIRGSGISVETSDVFIQNIKVRPGDDPRAECCKTSTCSPSAAQFCTQDPGSRDGINTYASSAPISNVVYDHISISWALDEGFSIAPSAGDISNITLSNSIVSNGLDMSIHPEASSASDPGHSKAVLINGTRSVNNLSFLKNLLAHNAERNIRVSTSVSMEYVNNIIYNWGRGKGVGRLIEATNTTAATHKFDLIGNIYIPGPDSYCPETLYRPELCATVANGIDTLEQRKHMHHILRVGSGLSGGLSANSLYFLQDNLGPTKGQIGAEWDIVDKGFFINSSSNSLIYPQNSATSAVSSSQSIRALNSATAYEAVLANAGAFSGQRDSVDNNVINNLINRDGRIINCVSDDGTPRCGKNAGGWPSEYAATSRSLELPHNPNADSDGNGYTDLEDWLHSFIP